MVRAKGALEAFSPTPTQHGGETEAQRGQHCGP